MRSVNRWIVGVTLAQVWFVCGIAAQDIGPYTPDEWDAVNILQGVVRTAVIDSGTLETTAKALRVIREWYPAVRHASTGPDETMLDLILTPMLSARVARLNGRAFEPSRGSFDAVMLDSGSLDSLNALYHVRRVRVEYFANRYLVHEWFAVPVNVPYVVGAYRDAGGVLWAKPPVYGGYEGAFSDASVVIKGSWWHFTFFIDSPAFDRQRRYYFTYDARSGSVTALGDGSVEGIQTNGVPLWQRSGETSLAPYDSYATLIRATGDSAWWIRRAAVEVLGFLFEHPNNPWGRERGRVDTARYVALKDSVWGNRVSVLDLLRRAQHDSDDDVRDAATGALRKAQDAGVRGD
jgi:hypothetical protein